jgi:hypothetical protein
MNWPERPAEADAWAADGPGGYSDEPTVLTSTGASSDNSDSGAGNMTS